MAGRRVDRLPLARRGPVTQAIVGRAQVRAALDHVARERVAVPGRAAPLGVRGGSGRESIPRRCRSRRRARSRWAGTRPTATFPRSRRCAGSATGTRLARCWPSPARPGTARHPRRSAHLRARRGRRTPTRPRSAARAPPTGVRLGVLVGDVRDGVARARSVRAGTFRPAPLRAGHVGPPGAVVVRRTGPGGRWKTSEPGTSSAGSAAG